MTKTQKNDHTKQTWSRGNQSTSDVGKNAEFLLTISSKVSNVNKQSVITAVTNSTERGQLKILVTGAINGTTAFEDTGVHRENYGFAFPYLPPGSKLCVYLPEGFYFHKGVCCASDVILFRIPIYWQHYVNKLLK